MSTATQVLLYVWVAVTAAAVVVWLLRRRARRRTERTLVAAATDTTATATDQDVVIERAPSGTEVDDSVGIAPHPATIAAGSTATDDDRSAETRPTATGERPEPQPRQSRRRQSLMDLLDGVALPYDLVPVVTAVEDPDQHMIFLTTHSNAEEVGTRFADEMIRLGFEVSAVGLDQAVATRGDDTLTMAIVPRADEKMEGDRPRYESAAPGDVALELWLGRAAQPPPVIFEAEPST